MTTDRRQFARNTAWAGLGLAALGPRAALRAVSRSDTVRVGVMGVNSRGGALATMFAGRDGCEVVTLCDVDSRASERVAAAVASVEGATQPAEVVDYRRMLEDDSLDAVVIAAPDHWHTPAAILALDAGKHVYVEKPCSHNAREGELLVEAAHKHHGRVVQMGNQQRSAPESIEIMGEIHRGLIGRQYYAKAWYANRRGPIGRGKQAKVPAWLDYEMWQGPAPRRQYRDNLIHYNWHWFWHWGTGEINNNGAHELDICRWALEVDYPVRVTSAGGRYHFDDDWEAFDTQIATYDFEGGRSCIWEGRSCNGRPVEGRGRGTSIHGEKGTVVVDRAGYVVYDHDNQEIRRRDRETEVSGLDTRGADGLTDLHVQNFLDTVRGKAKANAPIVDARPSVLLCHLGNIAQRKGRSLEIDPKTGRIRGDKDAESLWGREYEPGWEPVV
ncbi:MAG: Gfo/Idh/MocA family oxidoreductase [Acidobacteriota bacterium]|nr:Gfo/Idh/MocA family oxidoreductase [Acidobacteriota bacterium]